MWMVLFWFSVWVRGVHPGRRALWRPDVQNAWRFGAGRLVSQVTLALASTVRRRVDS
jgi:hypothetical protein